MNRCQRCGEVMVRVTDHNCGTVTITKDRLRTLEEGARAPEHDAILDAVAEQRLGDMDPYPPPETDIPEWARARWLA